MSTPDAITDIELLRRYAESGSQEAFADLVRRHGPLVYSAALRRVNFDRALAEDVSQLVFADLARQARRLRPRVLAGWLHQHTRYTAAKAVAREARRRKREKEAAMIHSTPQEGPDPWTGLAPVLDQALDSLQPADRDALLLRFFQQRPLEEVGRSFGISADAAQKRVARALERLRERLLRRGVAPSASALTALLVTQGAGAAPGGFLEALPGRALAAAAARSAGQGALTAAWNWKWAAGAAGAAGFLTVTAVQQIRIRELEQQVQAPAAVMHAEARLPAGSGSGPAAPGAAVPAPRSVGEIIGAAARTVAGGRQDVSSTTRALALLRLLPEEQIPEALEHVGSLPDGGARSLLQRYLLARWAESRPHEALAYIQENVPLENRPDVFSGIMESWSGRNPEAALAWLSKAGASAPAPQQESALAAVFRGLAGQGFEVALEKLAWVHGETGRAQALRGLVQAILTPEDREAALRAVGDMDDPELRLQARRAVIEQWAEVNPRAAAAWVQDQPPTWERRRLTDSLAVAWMQAEPQAAADWWTLQQPGADTRLKIINVWAHRDPSAAGRWLGAQPAGPESDLARMTFARQIAEIDPPAAVAWAQTLADPALRASTLQHVLTLWRERDPQAAEAFQQEGGAGGP